MVKILSLEFLEDPAIPLPGIYLRELRTYVLAKACPQVLAAAFFIKAPNPAVPQLMKGQTKRSTVRTRENHTAMRRDRVLVPTMAWMDLENRMLSERPGHKRPRTVEFYKNCLEKANL